MKTLYIVRGLPGSGKSTLGAKLAPNASYAADDYFMSINGEYIFDPSKLGEAHKACQEAVETEMGAGTTSIAVCNTFTQKWEVEPYLSKARKHGYTVNIIHCQSMFGNTHGVPETSIQAMANRWQFDIG